MKKLFLQTILTTLLCIIALPFQSNCATIRHTYYFSKPEIKRQLDGMDLIHFPNCYQAGKIGEPTLPLKPVALLLPLGQIADNISIVYKNERKYREKVRISPKQPPRTEFSSLSYQNFNQKLYDSENIYRGPEPLIQTHFLHGHPIAIACFSPVTYIPVRGEISYYSEVEVTIQTRPDRKANEALRHYKLTNTIAEKLGQLVDNDQEIKTVYTPQVSETNYDYLIITINAFIEDYQPLVHFYNERGIKTRIAIVEEIYQSTNGNDEPDKIRNYIIDQYLNFNISFVLLAGDADASSFGQMQVPIRGLYGKVISGQDLYESKNIPSDLYYAALDGNWNDNNDDKWGEPGEDDLLPELAVARICADNSDEIYAILNKIINYQLHPVIKDATKMLMAGEKMWNDPLSYGADYLDLLIGDQDQNGYKTVGMPLDLNFTYLYDKTLGSWNKDDLIEKINSGCNIIHHAGHSSSGTNMRLSRSDIMNENFINVNGREHLNPIIYSHGCSSAAIDVVGFLEQDCIAEMMLEIDNFASAYVGNSRYGWFNEGQTEGPNLHLHREFINALYSDTVVAIGAAHTLSKIRSAPFVTAPDQWEPGALRWCFYGCNVLGDPAMAIWTNQIKQFSNVNYPDNISSIPVNITIKTGVPGARVTVSYEGETIASSLTNGSGEATFNIDSVPGTNLKLSVSAVNYKPFLGQISITTTDVASSLSCNPLIFELKPIYPNPFNPEATIQFSTTRTSQVKLEIYNVTAQRIKILVDEEMSSGFHCVNWDGRNNSGNIASNGLYFIKLVSDEGVKIRTCVLLK